MRNTMRNTLHVGHDNVVVASHVVAIVGAKSNAAKRELRGAEQSHMTVDATAGRKSRAILVMDSGHLVVSSESVDFLAKKLDLALGADDEQT